MYYNGQGVSYNAAKTEKYLLAAANQGNVDAQALLAGFYWYQNTPEGFTKAKQWYEKAAAKNNAESMYALGYMYEHGNGVPQNYDLALNWYKKAAALQNSDAALAIGYLYDTGEGVTQNLNEANPNANYNLGLIYKYDENITKDEKKAVKYFEKAAELGHAKAQLELGFLYDTGIDGGKPDLSKAAMWYTKSAEQDNPNAQYNIGDMYLYGMVSARM